MTYMPIQTSRTVVVINASGRQGASFVRVASAVGWQVRAHMKDRKGIVAQDISSRQNVTVVEGLLSDPRVIAQLFEGRPELAFLNTVHWGDEVAIGKALADAAKKAGIRHLIYSSMPDHSTFGKGWKALPMWETKHKVEKYITALGLPATFLYTGCYHNNFTSLPYPLFRMELQDDGSFEWQAPFNPNRKMPWLDAEHDVGASVLQIFKQGPDEWVGKRVPLAFQYLTPLEVCDSFSRALQRPVHYIRGPISYEISVPKGYREHLDILAETLGDKEAPYFGPDLESDCTTIATKLWGGNRGMEEYAGEVFPVEEYNNGLRWMEEEDISDEEVDKKYTGAC